MDPEKVGVEKIAWEGDTQCVLDGFHIHACWRVREESTSLAGRNAMEVRRVMADPEFALVVC